MSRESTGAAVTPSALLAHLAFLALFPGFFFYQSALGAGKIGAVLGGYFSPVALLFLPLLAFAYLRETGRSRRFVTRIDFAFWGFLLYFALVAGFNYAAGAPVEVVKHHALAMSHLMTVFIVFRLADFTSQRFQWICLACYAGMTAIIFAMSVDGSFYLRLQGSAAGNAEAVATYQGFARSYLVTALVVLPFAKPFGLRFSMYAVSVAALFMNGARSELVAFLLLISIVEFFHIRNRGNRVLMAALLLLAGTVALLYADALVALLPVNRSVQLLDIAKASSWEARNFLFSKALETIAEHPVLGDYGSYFYLYSNAGSYAHNIFSAWVDLGFPGFIWLLCMLLLPMRLLSARLLSGKTKSISRDFMLTFSLLLVTLIMLIAAKSFTYMIIGAALGRYGKYRQIRFRSENAHAESRTSHLGAFPLRHTDLRQTMP